MTGRRMVHIVDDDEDLRRSGSFLLEASGYAVTTWSSGIGFLGAASQFGPACALLDIHMPGITGLEVQAAMTVRGIAMPVIMLTGHGDVQKAVQAMKGGAIDFLEKPFEKIALLRAIETGFRRLERDNADDNRREAANRIGALTPRERDILNGLARGLSNRGIGEDLEISTRTVEVHRANMMTKLDVKSLSEALRLAFLAGITE